MKDKNIISDEILNAYVDGELSISDQAEVMEALRANPTLAEKMCELRALKEMVKVSYSQPPSGEGSKKSGKITFLSRSRHGIAASIVAFLVLVLGSIMGYQLANRDLSPDSSWAQLNSIQQMDQKVLLHIGTDNSERIQLALDNAEHLLNSFTNNQQNVQLQILVNAEGIHMLNVQHSPYIKRIKKLSERYENVAFLACQRSIERQKLQGVEIHLVKEASVVAEALQTVVNRLKSGWVYIRA